LHDGNWKDLLSRIVITPEPPPMVVIADPSERSVWAEAINLGAYDVIAKPLDKREAAYIISRAARHKLSSVTQAFAHH
jgi:DNA-binding NtrC family response regulator